MDIVIKLGIVLLAVSCFCNAIVTIMLAYQVNEIRREMRDNEID